jgi:endoribonuclease Nob1
MKVVLDTSALIYLNDFRNFSEIFTVQEVVDEVKDETTEMKLRSLKLKIVEPKKISLEKVEDVARKTGDLEKLSKTDLKVLAVAEENSFVIISDDRNVQNVAEELGIKYISIFNKEISKKFKWKKVCKSCGYTSQEGDACPRCGSRMIRVVKEKVERRKKPI